VNRPQKYDDDDSRQLIRLTVNELHGPMGYYLCFELRSWVRFGPGTEILLSFLSPCKKRLGRRLEMDLDVFLSNLSQLIIHSHSTSPTL